MKALLWKRTQTKERKKEPNFYNCNCDAIRVKGNVSTGSYFMIHTPKVHGKKRRKKNVVNF